MPVKYIANNNLTNQYGMLGGGPHYSGGVYSGGVYSGGAYLQGDSPYGMMVSPYYGGSNYKDVRYTGGVHYSGGEYSGGMGFYDRETEKWIFDSGRGSNDVERELDNLKRGAGYLYSGIQTQGTRKKIRDVLGNYLSAVETGSLKTSQAKKMGARAVLTSVVQIWNKEFAGNEKYNVSINQENFQLTAPDENFNARLNSGEKTDTSFNIPPSPAPSSSSSSSMSGYSIYDLKSPPPSMPPTPQITYNPYSLPNPPPSGNMAPSSISNTQNIGESAAKLSKDIGFINSNLPISTTQASLLSQKMADEDAIVHNFVESKKEQDNNEEFDLDEQLPPLPQETIINYELNLNFKKSGLSANDIKDFFEEIQQVDVYQDLMSRPVNEAVKAFTTLLSPVANIIFNGTTDDVSLTRLSQMLNDYKLTYNRAYIPPSLNDFKRILAISQPEEKEPELVPIVEEQKYVDLPPIEQKYGDLPPIDYTDRQYELPLTEEELTPLEMIPFEDVSQPVNRQQAQINNINAINEPASYSNQIANAMRGVGSLASRMFFGQPRTPEDQSSMRQQQTAREATAPIEQQVATAIDQQNRQVAPIEQQLATAIDQQNIQVAPAPIANVVAPDVRQIEIQTGKLQDIINSLAQAIIDNNENNTKFTKQVQIEMLKSLEAFGTKATKDLSLLFSPVPTIVSNAIKNLPASIRNDPQTLQSLTEVVKMATGYRGIDDKPIPVPPRIQLTASKELTEARSGIPGWYKSNFKLERAPSRLLQPEEFKYIYRIATR